MTFDDIVDYFERKFKERYNRAPSRLHMYWDAVNFDLYASSPFYIEENDDVIKQYNAERPENRCRKSVLREKPPYYY